MDGFFQSCVCTIFILINSLHMQNVRHMQFVTLQSPDSQWSVISTNFRKILFVQVGNLISHDWGPMVNLTSAEDSPNFQRLYISVIKSEQYFNNGWCKYFEELLQQNCFLNAYLLQVQWAQKLATSHPPLNTFTPHFQPNHILFQNGLKSLLFEFLRIHQSSHWKEGSGYYCCFAQLSSFKSNTF